MTRHGLSLVELLVALAMGAVVLAAASSSLVTTGHFSARVELRGIEAQRRVAVPLLLREVIAAAGRGLEGCGLEVVDHGTRLRLASIPPGGMVPVTTEVFADLDGGGRPALYQRTVPHPRQPYLEDVVAFVVMAGRDDVGHWRTVEHDGAVRWTALDVQLSWTDGDQRRYLLELPHAVCAEALP